MNNTLTKPIVFLILFFSITSFGQSTYGLLSPQDPNNGTECKACINAFRKKPKEVRFAIKKDNQDNLFFEISHKQWLNILFKDDDDGFLIDIISKNKYDCSLETIETLQSGIEGTALPPIYAKKIKSGLKKQANGRFRVKVGSIPENLKNQELEFNLFFINDNYLCRYNKIYNLKSYDLELLDMGMYLDSISYNSNFKKPSDLSGYKIKYKTLEFKIPFEKNKAKYSSEDIKPVYDSLNLTSFDIKKISIKAYSSVEGSLKRNIELQSQRAQSIADAMQQFQTPVIKTSISATENWVEFLNDITGTKYAFLADLSQAEIKNKLRESNLNNDLEPYLKNHRKALITLELDKKDSYKKMASDQLLSLFQEKISSKELMEANTIQNVIFDRIQSNEISPDRITDLDVPLQKENIDFITKNTSFKYLLDARQGMISYNKLLEIDKSIPNNKKVKYNLCVLKFTIWQNDWEPIETKKLKQQILALKQYGISQVLIDRMLINFEILKAEAYMFEGDFKNKDKSTANIYSKYKDKLVRDSDFLNLANYFSLFANQEYSKNLLQNKVQDINVGEDLLFYYLNLTIIDDQLTQTKEYRAMMLNAYSKNSERFCNLFNALDKDGITFQLLENDFLRKTYCENCNK